MSMTGKRGPHDGGAGPKQSSDTRSRTGGPRGRNAEGRQLGTKGQTL